MRSESWPSTKVCINQQILWTYSYTMCLVVFYKLPSFGFDDCENICTSSSWHYHFIGSIDQWLWYGIETWNNNCMRCMFHYAVITICICIPIHTSMTQTLNYSLLHHTYTNSVDRFVKKIPTNRMVIDKIRRQIVTFNTKRGISITRTIRADLSWNI